MRLKLPIGTLFFLAAGLLALVCPRAGHAVSPPGDLRRLLPEDTRLAFYIPDAPSLLEKWRASPMGRFYEDSHSGSFLNPLRGRLKELRGLLVDEAGIDPRRLDAFFSGRWLLAGLPAPEGSSSPVAWVLIFDHNNDPLILERFRSGGGREGASVQSSAREASGFRYQRLRLSEAVPAEIPITSAEAITAPGTAPALDVRRSAVHVTDQYFNDRLGILALADGDPIRRVLARLAHPGDEPSLAERAERQSMAEGLPPGGDVECFADTAALFTWLAAHPRPELAWLNLAALRLGEMRAAGATLHFTAKSFDAHAVILASAQRQGLARLIFPSQEPNPGPEIPANPAAEEPALRATGLVPADALTYSAVRWPLGEAWTTGRELLRGVAPPLALTLDGQVRAVEQATGLDVRRDLLDLLGPEITRFSRASGPAGRQRIHTTYMVRLRQPQRVRMALLTLLGALSQRYGAFYIEDDRAGERSVVRLYLGNPAAAGGPGQKLEALLCLDGDWLIAGRNPADIAEVLNRLDAKAGGGIADEPDFKAVMDRLPAGRLAEGYIDLPALHRQIGSMTPGGAGYRSALAGGDWLPLDLRTLTRAAPAGEPLGRIGYASHASEDRLHISAFILYP